ncbi:hypothetical protein TRFO_34684 [Tritrichomonas foetus]|uniref:Uncharacterized protein n=1 Tax=Tritrichomonas foetus TaxID=1144522 RepID=A0A1J4JNW1_9EUKA|nr:hypothetical protein TRFO_34684 [Tritrichomonas foetus]|eukprot:OHS98956.1 hypothetical protein TRFO_34684 [Tritrichomonas foetus]
MSFNFPMINFLSILLAMGVSMIQIDQTNEPHKSNNTCSHIIVSSYGMKQFSANLRPNELVCINITIFDYFIVLNQMPEDSIIYEYRSNPNGTERYLYSQTSLDQLNIYMHIPSPFASQTIYSKKGGFVSFAYGSLPDLCSTGIIFTNSQHIDSIIFSGTEDRPYHIDINDDLCIVSTIPAIQSYSLSMQTEKCCDKLFFYKSMIPQSVFGGSISETFDVDATEEPAIFRFVSDNKTDEYKYIKVIMGSDGLFPFEAGIVFYDPLNNSNVCPDGKCNFSDYFDIRAIIYLILGIILIILSFSLIFYFSARCFCPHFVIYTATQNHQTSENNDLFGNSVSSVESRGEIAGYFALDPILRPKE